MDSCVKVIDNLNCSLILLMLLLWDCKILLCDRTPINMLVTEKWIDNNLVHFL
jgi:hypothetical protein